MPEINEPAVQESVDDAVTTAESSEAPPPEQDHTEPSEDMQDDQTSFPRAYVEKLRDESARYRQRAQRADELARALFAARVELTGRLADPTDLPFDEEALADPAKLDAAIADLLNHKPHLASRRPFGNIGQGAADGGSSVDLAGILRSRA